MTKLIFTTDYIDQEKAQQACALRSLMVNLEKILGSAVQVKEAYVVNLAEPVAPVVEQLIWLSGLDFERLLGGEQGEAAVLAAAMPARAASRTGLGCSRKWN